MEDNKTYYILIGIIIAAAAIFLISRPHGAVTSSVSSTEGTIGNLQKGTPPWPAEFAHLRERLAAIGLPALTQEGTALHIHQHLDIMVNGQPVAVPAGLGVDSGNQFISPIHVHDASGIIHVESPTVQTFTLGQFFDLWGLAFTNQCIGGECTTDSTSSPQADTKSLRVYVNGQLYQGDPRAIALAAHQEIFIFYGTAAQLPKTIPATFAFRAGL